MHGFEGVIIDSQQPEDPIEITRELPVIEHHGVHRMTAGTATLMINGPHGILAEFDDFEDVVLFGATIIRPQKSNFNGTVTWHFSAV